MPPWPWESEPAQKYLRHASSAGKAQNGCEENRTNFTKAEHGFQLLSHFRSMLGDHLRSNR